MFTRGLTVTILSLMLASFAFPDGLAAADDKRRGRAVTIREDRAGGTARHTKIRRFGNKKRIARLAEPCARERAGSGVVLEDRMGKPTCREIRRFGNRNRIARIANAAARDLSGRVVVVKDTYGRVEMVAIKRFGNRRRIEKRLGPGSD